jgi:PII-like signaling protein
VFTALAQKDIDLSLPKQYNIMDWGLITIEKVEILRGHE